MRITPRVIKSTFLRTRSHADLNKELEEKIQSTIKGLDTKDKILKTVAFWRKGCWKRRQKKAGNLVAIEEQK
ncbi:hypothetical protein BGZ88_001695 [Linnemannia elongata]|nr:hypothetical protein BGZ88_001695 [Linnemannia elongata]